MLVAFLLAIPNMDDASKQGWNVFFWTIDSITNPVVAKVLYVAIFVSQFLCGLATVTSASRMIYAFSRDGGLPFSKALASVSKSYRTPSVAIWTAAVLSVLFVWGASLVTIAGSSAYTIVVSCTVIFLFLSFAVPIVLGIKAIGTAKWPKMGPWNMGIGAYRFVSVLVIIAMAIIFVIGVQPPNQWALYITIGFLVLTGIIWFAFEKRRFLGPPIGDMIAKRQGDIAAAERAVGEV
jgi:amino acid transporter